MRACLTLLPPAVLFALTAGCGDTMIGISSDGQIEVSVSTIGSDVDEDGFEISVDGGTTQFVSPGGQVTLTGLDAGRHIVQLSGLAQNCRVLGFNPQGVSVGSDGRATVAFQVSCVQATRGGFNVSVVTTGSPADSNGYMLAVDGANEIRPIKPNALETFLDLTAGRHLVTLKDVDEGCALVGGNPQLHTVVPGKTVTIHLTVSCGPPA